MSSHRDQLAAVVFATAALTACSSVDQRKFNGAYMAGIAVETSISTHGSADDPAIDKFATEVAALDGRSKGSREESALQNFHTAADAYRDFSRFQFLDAEERGSGKIMLMMNNLRAIDKYQLHVLSTSADGEAKWVSAKEAIDAARGLAKSNLSAANDIVNGKR